MTLLRYLNHTDFVIADHLPRAAKRRALLREESGRSKKSGQLLPAFFRRQGGSAHADDPRGAVAERPQQETFPSCPVIQFFFLQTKKASCITVFVYVRLGWSCNRIKCQRSQLVGCISTKRRPTTCAKRENPIRIRDFSIL